MARFRSDAAAFDEARFRQSMVSPGDAFTRMSASQIQVDLVRAL
jgi:hypothetical protein